MRFKTKHCIDCGKLVCDDSIRCNSCANSISLKGNTNGFKKGGHPGVEFGKGQKGHYIHGFSGFHKGYGNHKISFEHFGCVWHHVNMMFMVACPQKIHEHCLHHVLGKAGIHAHYLEGVLG